MAPAPPPAAVLGSLHDYLGRATREMLSGSPEQRPFEFDPTADRIHGPSSAVWAVHRDLSTLIGGLRALLLQTMHPLALAGVNEHSNYRTEPLGRLQRTAAFIATTTFGTRAEAEQAIARVIAVHDRVSGTAPDGRPYEANDPHLLQWVHCTEVDSLLRSHERYGGTSLVSGAAEQYVAEMAEVAALLGVIDPPTTRAELRDRLIEYRPELKASKTTHETVRFLAVPPLALAARPAYGVLFSAAASMLPGFVRRELRIPLVPFVEPVLIRPLATMLLRTLGWALGSHPATDISTDSQG